MPSKKGDVVAKATFPLYTVQSLSRGKFLVGGGGGTAKTGVPNAFEVYEVSLDGSEVRKLVTVNTDDAVMSCAAIDASNTIYVYCTEGVAWRSYNVQLYEAPKVDDNKLDNGDDKTDGDTDGDADKTDKAHTSDDMELRERKKASKDSEESQSAKRGDGKGQKAEVDSSDPDILDLCAGWKVDLRKGKLMECKFEIEKENFYHGVLCFSKDKNCVITGSSDGKIRVWPLSTSEKVVISELKIAEVEAHKGEINDLALDPVGARIISLCRSVDALTLWTIPGLKKLTTLSWSPGNNIKYKARAVKFAAIENNRNKCRLFTIYNPAVRSTKLPSYLVKWDCPTYVASKSVVTGKEDLCSLTVSSDGDYVAVGTLSGSVSIYIAFSLQKLLHVPESHSTFVTGLTFLPQKSQSKYDASLISVSADSKVKLYHVQKRLMVPFALVALLAVACLVLAYFILDVFNV